MEIEKLENLEIHVPSQVKIFNYLVCQEKILDAENLRKKGCRDLGALAGLQDFPSKFLTSRQFGDQTK